MSDAGKLRVILTKDYDGMTKTAASLLGKEVRTQAWVVIGLATGSTPLGTYQELNRLHKEEGLDFSGIRAFNLDEYLRLPPEHPESYHAFMAKNLFNYVNVNPGRYPYLTGWRRMSRSFAAITNGEQRKPVALTSSFSA